ncbi:Serine phosphatase RsbU, regulator of sigma subunit [Pseudoalteromonas luteoviolacea B = ATCC 29581]|nr:Serine phosphatase RsbU, regulator of sigma subunit [Pseudoalteromonas luteoviolacea B = ATCC 29581]
MRILVVDDQPLNCTLLRAMLEQQRYDVVVAANGKEAIDIVEQQEIDIVLLDVMMPVMDGFEAAPIIKRLTGEVYLPIIFITALEDHASFEKCLAVGGDDFIHKPFDRVILSAKIKAHARTRKLSQESHAQKKILEYHANQVEREHEIVEHIFKNALNEQAAYPTHCDFHLSPASMFNGDMFLLARSPMGGLYCMLGDFTGHGLAAAVGALPASRVFYTMVNKGMSVSDIAHEMNSLLNNLLPGHMFCAATIFELNESGRSLSMWLGGLPDAYLIDSQGKIIKTIESQHMALGILDEDEFERNLIHLEVSSQMRLLVSTDGIIETENSDGDFFGDEKLKRLIASTSNISTQDIVNTVKHFAGSDEQQDDLSIAILNCLPLPSIKSSEVTYSQLPLSVSMSLNAHQIRTTDPVLELVDVLSKVEGLSAHRSNVFLLMSEAYNNAVDHGVLGLDSAIKDKEDGFFEFYSLRAEALSTLKDAMVILTVSYEPDNRRLVICICDSGNGFTHQREKEHCMVREHGRGLSLLQEIASSVCYNQAGNEVEMIYSLK